MIPRISLSDTPAVFFRDYVINFDDRQQGILRIRGNVTKLWRTLREEFPIFNFYGPPGETAAFFSLPAQMSTPETLANVQTAIENWFSLQE